MKRSFLRPFFVLVIAFGAISMGFAVTASNIIRNLTAPLPSDAVASPAPAEITVVIDAGHGGEDGGAVSANGICEKDVNLQIASILCDALKERGIRVIMTRTEDVLLYDRTVDYQGRKKALDLAARKKIAEESGSCIFVSIHLNSFPLTQYRGLQVWYSKNDPASFALAEAIRTTVKTALQPENNRACKAATSSIYLLHHLHVPAVLVECGFLSNPEEAALLADENYQRELAGTLADAIVGYLQSASRETLRTDYFLQTA